MVMASQFNKNKGLAARRLLMSSPAVYPLYCVASENDPLGRGCD